MQLRFAMALAVSLSFLAVPQGHAAGYAPLPVVVDFKIANIYGQYYEIATYLQWYSTNCTNTGIAFGPTNRPGTTAVTMSCDRGIFHPKVNGFAVPLSTSVPARMWVTLHPPVGGDFQQEFDVIMAAQNFSYFVIGHPSRAQLFILNRSPTMAHSTLNYIFSRLESFYGYSNVRKNAACTRHDGYSNDYCRSALVARTFWDDYILD